jgi:RNA polymerase sigma factor (TIGR02999 family)
MEKIGTPERYNMSELTELLHAARQGESAAVAQLCTLLYQDLHQIAHARLRRHERMLLLNTTALVHESYLRLLQARHLDVMDRSHFLAYAARVMRTIIVDFVRHRLAHRRGGGARQVTLQTDIAEVVPTREETVLQVNEALEALAKVDERLVRVVEMRYFAGVSEQDIAAALGVTERTVRRDWQKARLLLLTVLQEPESTAVPA